MLQGWKKPLQGSFGIWVFAVCHSIIFSLPLRSSREAHAGQLRAFARLRKVASEAVSVPQFETLVFSSSAKLPNLWKIGESMILQEAPVSLGR